MIGYRDYNYTVVKKDGTKEHGLISCVYGAKEARQSVRYFYPDAAFIWVEADNV